jgi:alkyl hydroperoxide reductase subunit AhpC
MIELGQLERRSEDFARRQTRVIAASLEGTEDAAKTQAENPHLLILADDKRGLSEAAGLIHANSNPHGGGDTSAPTTILVDHDGIVRWIYRSGSVVARLSPDEVLQALDAHMPAAR